MKKKRLNRGLESKMDRGGVEGLKLGAEKRKEIETRK